MTTITFENNQKSTVSHIYKGEVKAYGKTDTDWIRTINCTSYTIIFEIPSEASDVEYEIRNKKGKPVGILRNSKGLLCNIFFIVEDRINSY